MKLCKTCAYPLARSGAITNWNEAAKYKVKPKQKACKKCPARKVLK